MHTPPPLAGPRPAMSWDEVDLPPEEARGFAARGWDPAGWAAVDRACASDDPALQAYWRSDGPWHVEARTAEDVLAYLAAPGLLPPYWLTLLAADVPIVFLIACKARSVWLVDRFWAQAARLGLDGDDAAGWVRAGMLGADPEHQQDVGVLGEAVPRWVEALGDRAWLWPLAGFTDLSEARAAHARGLGEEDLRALVALRGNLGRPG